QPEWLSHVNANVLKVKLATAIIGISSIHLLKTFISAESLSDKTMLWQTVIHLAFIVSALSIAWIDRMLSGASSQAH
ncbi:MAG: TIGR00645 family protein, partial [Betaproteobacteria bacterium]|nr:TIGR00645 family protein [Betaproteobacteria bacterium]